MINQRMGVAACVAAVWGILGTAQPVRATGIFFVGSQGNLSAMAEFQVSGNNLVVTLTNPSLNDVMDAREVLSCVFFDVLGAPVTLTPVSAVIGPTSVVNFGTTDPGGVVGGEWFYEASLFGGPGNAHQGIGSAGVGLFTSNSPFPGSNLQGPPGPDAIEYGITSAGDIPTTGSPPVQGLSALIQNQVIFTLSGLPQGFDPAQMITNVWFHYGADAPDPQFPGERVPEPGTLGLLALGALSMLRMRRA